MSNLEEWQQNRIKFYTQSKAFKFINDYFNVKKGTRMLIGHIKDMYKFKKDPTYRLYQHPECRYITLPDIITNKYEALKNYWCNHTSIYTFDKNLFEYHNEKITLNLARTAAIGINAVIELDSPDDPNSDKAKRLSFFDYINEFNIAISHIDKTLTNLTTDYNLMFSGNGIYIILEGYYEDNLEDYKENFINLLDTLKEKEELGDKLKVHIDNWKAPWNDYFKIPFTFHDSRKRISIPLPKKELDGEWINRVSNSDNIINDYNTIDEIIQKANWRKLW